MYPDIYTGMAVEFMLWMYASVYTGMAVGYILWMYPGIYTDTVMTIVHILWMYPGNHRVMTNINSFGIKVPQSIPVYPINSKHC